MFIRAKILSWWLIFVPFARAPLYWWWATLTSIAKNCHCERSEAIASFTLRLLRYARNDMSLIRKIRYQLAWDTTPLLRSYEISVVVISDSDSDSDAGVGYLFLEVGQ